MTHELTRPRGITSCNLQLINVGYHPGRFVGHRHPDGLSLSRDLERPRDLRIMSFYRQEPSDVSYHLVKFGGLGLAVVKI